MTLSEGMILAILALCIANLVVLLTNGNWWEAAARKWLAEPAPQWTTVAEETKTFPDFKTVIHLPVTEEPVGFVEVKAGPYYVVISWSPEGMTVEIPPFDFAHFYTWEEFAEEAAKMLAAEDSDGIWPDMLHMLEKEVGPATGNLAYLLNDEAPIDDEGYRHNVSLRLRRALADYYRSVPVSEWKVFA